jgi:hypothetical protein
MQPIRILVRPLQEQVAAGHLGVLQHVERRAMNRIVGAEEAVIFVGIRTITGVNSICTTTPRDFGTITRVNSFYNYIVYTARRKRRFRE